jgi:hypothetical protein
MWAELSPTPKNNKKNKKIKNRKCRYKNFTCLRKLYFFFSIYSLISGSGIKKEKEKEKENILIFWWL